MEDDFFIRDDAKTELEKEFAAWCSCTELIWLNKEEGENLLLRIRLVILFLKSAKKIPSSMII